MNPVTGSLQLQWKRYRKALKRCQRKFSPGAIHDFRIETRRLLSGLELLGSLLPARRLDKARRLLKRPLDLFDELRDTQVLLETLARTHRRFSTARLFRVSLLKREQRCARRTRKQIQKVRTRRLGKLVNECQEDLAEQLANSTPRKALAALMRSAHRAFRRACRLRACVNPSDTATIHRARVAFKKFRYMVEALGQSLTAVPPERLVAMRRYQTMMGNIQDSAVLLAALDRFLLKERVSPESARLFRAQLLRRRQRLIRRYLAAADQLLAFWPLPEGHFPQGDTPKPT